MAGQQEVFPHEFFGFPPHLFKQASMLQQIANPQRRALRRADQESGMVVDHLEFDSADIAADDGLSFPHRLRNRKAKAFTDGFLHYQVGNALEGVDGAMGISRQEQQVNIRVAIGLILHFLKDPFAFGIIRRPAAGQHQLKGSKPPGEAAGTNGPHRVLEAVKAGNLHHNGALGVEVKALPHLVDLDRVQFHVLVTQRVDTGRNEVLRMRKGLHEIRQRPDACIVARHELTQIFPHRTIRVAQIDMAAPDPFAFPVGAKPQKGGRLRIVDEYEIRLLQFIL